MQRVTNFNCTQLHLDPFHIQIHQDFKFFFLFCIDQIFDYNTSYSLRILYFFCSRILLSRISAIFSLLLMNTCIRKNAYYSSLFWQIAVTAISLKSYHCGLKNGCFSENSTCAQCGNFMIFLSLRFYVKSFLVTLEVQILPF